MRAIRDKHTSPELLVRSAVHRRGYRYGLHSKRLVGKPDLVCRKLNLAVFVHGCFWHMHGCKRGSRIPKSNKAYWAQKISRNVNRDRKQLSDLRRSGWKVCVIWECEAKNPAKLELWLNKHFPRRT